MRGCTPEAAELLGAEAWAAGASGSEERTEEAGITLLVYAEEAAAGRVESALRAAADRLAEGGASPAVIAVEPVAADEGDWSERWKEGLEAVVVSERLVIRPSWVPAPAGAAAELVIDPRQAFGTGGHASTLLALAWIDALAEAGRLGPDAQVLDVGTGTGVLALAALRLGAASALGLDVDPVAAIEARGCAARNGLGARFRPVAGSTDCLRRGARIGSPRAGERGFDLVLANLLRREVLPLLPSLAALARRGALAVFSGLLAEERDEVERALASAGFAPATLAGSGPVRSHRDAGGETWVALLTERA